MAEAKLYIEGGGDSKEVQIRCRSGFKKLLINAGFTDNLPRTIACGGRHQAYERFCTAIVDNPRGFVGLMVDSEEPVADLEKPWSHLNNRDGWLKPTYAADEQVLLMVTCMETWCIADPDAVKKFHDPNGKWKFKTSDLPSSNLENRTRHEILSALEHATRKCAARYEKGTRSFDLLGCLNPTMLGKLKSFERTIRILRERL